MRVFIAGIDGYLGWPLAQHLAARDHIVGGLDRFLRRAWVDEVGGVSAVPVASWADRVAAFAEAFGQDLSFFDVDMLDYQGLRQALESFQPDAVVHLAEQPSAPFSMIDQRHASFTQQNNVIGSLNLLWALHEVAPEAHLLKLGTMGEYGTPNVDIPEGFFEIEYRGRRDVLPFPRQAGSFYHWSKVHDSNNTMFACKIWGLRATDVMQGVVYGTNVGKPSNDGALKTSQAMTTRLDFDTCFGTVINRFVCQAVIGHPLTIYGTGEQQRGFLPLQDSMECLTLALESPPAAGEYRVFNQFDRTYSVRELADTVVEIAHDFDLHANVELYENPRIEQQTHHYQPDRRQLLDLGYQPTGNVRAEVGRLFEAVLRYRSHIEAYRSLLVPAIRWDSQHRQSQMMQSTNRST